MSTKHDIVLKQQSYYKSNPNELNSSKSQKARLSEKVQLISDVKPVVELLKLRLLHTVVLLLINRLNNFKPYAVVFD